MVFITSNYDYETIKTRVRHFDRLIPTFKWGKRMCWEFIYVRFPDGTHWRLY